MTKNYIKTPSFYNNEAYFEKYLGCTSYYLSLQKVVTKLVNLIQPRTVLELGSALGTTTLLLADHFRDIHFIGADIRGDVVEKANKGASNYENVSFIESDMCELATSESLAKYDLIFLLYSFHHIEDPLENKVSFLRNCCKNMKPGSYLLIVETFIPEDSESLQLNQRIVDLFKIRSEEGYASTFWAALETLSAEGVDLAKTIGDFSKKEESKAGDLVNSRVDEYLVKFSWLIEQAKEAGFKIVIAEPVNAIGEKAILLKKD